MRCRAWIAALFATLTLVGGAEAAPFKNFRKAPVAPALAVTPGTTLFSLLATGSVESTECANSDVTAVTGQALTVTGAITRTCEKSDGTLVVSALNKPRVMLVNGVLSLLVEPTVTNAALRSCDMSNATWVKSNMTAAKTATGPTGVANSASRLTATADNATALQAITHTSGIRSLTMRLKRIAGSGPVSVTLDGSTWLDVTASLSTLRYNRMTPDAFPGLSVTQTNASIGIKLSTSGDVVEAAFWQYEAPGAATFYSSDVTETGAAAVSRGNESVSITNPLQASNPSQWFLQATVTPYTAAQTWTFNSNKGVMTTGAYAAANTTGILIPASGRFQVTTVDAASGTKSWVLNPPSPMAAGTHTLVHAHNGASVRTYLDGAAVSPGASGAGTGIVTTHGATAFLGGTSAVGSLQGFISNIKIGTGNWPPSPL